MKNNISILGVVILILLILSGPVFADYGRGSTMVRWKNQTLGSPTDPICVADDWRIGTDGVVITTAQVETSTWNGAKTYWSLSAGWIEDNITIPDEKVKVSGDDTTPGYLGTKLTDGDGLTGTVVDPAGNETLDLDVNVKAGVLEIDGDDVDIADDGVDDDHIDFGTGANQVDSADVPNDTTNFDGNLDGTDTDVLAALETLDELPIGGGVREYFLETTASDIGGYKEMSPTYAADAGRNSSATIVADGTAIEEWATSPTEPDLTFLETGVYDMHLHAEQTGGTKDSTIYFEIHKRASGGGETLLGTSHETGNLTGADTLYVIHAFITEQAILATDRLVIKVIGNESGAGSDPVVQINYQGATLTRFEFPAQAGGGTAITLDIAYDNGSAIDYSNGNGPVDMLFPDNGTTDTHNGLEVMNLFMDTDEVDTANAVMAQMHWNVDIIPGAAKFMSFWGLNGTPAEVLYFLTDGSIYSDVTIAAEGSLVTGDADSEGSVVFNDGDGETVTLLADDVITSVAVDIDKFGAWTDDYLLSLNDLGGNIWEITPIDPAVTGINTHLLMIEFSNSATLAGDTWSKLGEGITTSATVGWIPMRDCSITGMSCQVTAALVGDGVWDIEIYANGGEVWSDTLAFNGDTSICYQTQAAGTDSVTAGQVISVNFNQTAGIEPLQAPHVLVELTYD